MKKLLGSLFLAGALLSTSPFAQAEDVKVKWADGVLVYQSANGDLSAQVRAATEADISTMVTLNRQAFPHDNATDAEATRWIQAHVAAKDFSRYYVITFNNPDKTETVVGYALWTLDGGFNSLTTARQDQFVISEAYRDQRFGKALQRLSLLQFEKDVLASVNGKIERVYVTVGSKNDAAKEVYEDALGFEEKCSVGALFGSNSYGDEEKIFVNTEVQKFLQENDIKDLLD